MYIAHKNARGETQPLKQHLENVASLCSGFASAFHAEEHAYKVGLLHDIGKYAPDIQERMRDPEHTPKRNHTSAGAQTAYRQKDLSAAVAIAGHHGGLQDLPDLRSGKFCYRPLGYSDYENEVNVPDGVKEPEWIEDRQQFSFYTRMLFSCLVDADYLDTERFMGSAQRQSGISQGKMAELLEKVEQYIRPWSSPTTALNAMRLGVQNDCRKKAALGKGLFSLTVPTGGGKTVSSLLFALLHAVRHQMTRIIYVIPYTNIIEQTAAVFSAIVGEENVLEHHSGVLCDTDPFSEDLASEAQRQKQLAMENWDAPIIVTTSVQFFESVYHRQTGSSRKLHSIAGSVVIFDEAQMLPLDYLQPCLFAIGELVRHYGVSAVLCTATQPDLRPLFEKLVPQCPIREITEDPARLQLSFQRVTYQDDGTVSLGALAETLDSVHTALCIVNTRASARQLFQLLKEPGCYHLSTLMTPRHRKAVLQTIRERLRSGMPCRVVSTSLIEAGVDLDFPTVYRERAGLDSILQSGGRCNREGKRSKGESRVYIFDLADKRLSPDLQQRIRAFQYAVEAGNALDSLEAIRRYSTHTIFNAGSRCDKYRILEGCERLNFETVSRDFHLIHDEDAVTVCIPNKENAALIDAVQRGTFNRSTLRRLQQDCVSIHRSEAERLIAAGSVSVTDSGLFILQNADGYSEACGLCCDAVNGNAIFL